MVIITLIMEMMMMITIIMMIINHAESHNNYNDNDDYDPFIKYYETVYKLHTKSVVSGAKNVFGE